MSDSYNSKGHRAKGKGVSPLFALCQIHAAIAEAGSLSKPTAAQMLSPSPSLDYTLR